MTTTIIVAITLGIASYGLTMWLDRSMDYGHIFQNIRYKKAKKLAPERFENLELGTDAVQEMHNIYAAIALRNNQFKLWICTFCFGTRINLLLSGVGLLTVANILQGFFLIIISLSIFTIAETKL